MNTIVNRVLPDGTIEKGWVHFTNEFGDEYNLVSLMMTVSGRSGDLLFPERREKMKPRIRHGKLGSVFFEHDGIVYITVSSVESLNRRKKRFEKLIEKRCRTKARKSR